MCRNIKTLFNFDPPATDIEIQEAATQYVRKVSGFSTSSKLNEIAINDAVTDITRVSQNLLERLVTSAKPRSREREAEKT